MNPLDEFKKKYEPKYKLKKYTTDIVDLLDDGFSQNQILLYLEEYHNLKVSLATLARQIAYIKKTIKKNTTSVRAEPQKKVSESEPQKARAEGRVPEHESISELVQKMKNRRQDDK